MITKQAEEKINFWGNHLDDPNMVFQFLVTTPDDRVRMSIVKVGGQSYNSARELIKNYRNYDAMNMIDVYYVGSLVKPDLGDSFEITVTVTRKPNEEHYTLPFTTLPLTRKQLDPYRPGDGA